MRIPFVTMIIKRSFQSVEVLKAEGDQPAKVVFVASDSTPDSFGDRILVKGIDLSRYLANPVLLWSHDHSLPAIGTASVYVEGEQLKMEPTFSQVGDLAQEVAGKVADGTLKAVSVGLKVDLDSLQENSFGGFDFAASELIEISMVNVPANPSALREKSIQDLIDQRQKSAEPAPELSPVGANSAPTAAPTPAPLNTKDEDQMDLTEIEKKLKALATETVERALADRDATATTATPVPAPAVVTSTKALSPAEKMGLFIQRAGGFGQTSGKGSELLPAPTAGELVGTLQEGLDLAKLGAPTLTYDNTLTVGRINAPAATGWVAEGASVTVTDLGTDAVVLGSKHLSAVLPCSDQLLANPSASSAIGQDMLAAVSAAVFAGLVQGDGTGNNPSGLITQLNAANKAAANTTSPTVATIRKEIINTIAKVRKAKVQFVRPVIVMDPQSFANLQAHRDGAGNAYPSLELEQPMLFGIPVFQNQDVSGFWVQEMSQTRFGIAKGFNVQTAKVGNDAINNMTTVYARFIGDAKLMHDKSGAYLSGTATAWAI